jgi:endonuclease/exonuclease/phosphatase family metal-dependent hydrolase
MHINDDELVDERTQATFVNKLTKALVQYKTGAVKRSKQIEQLIKDIKKSPYKVIIAGDLNDPPYSYTYEKLSKHLKNAFEEKGTGFGFTYNGKLPMLRIDQQFCDKGIKVCSFKTKNKIKFTDHVPIIGTYSLE